MYSIQALWTAAHHKLPLTVVIVNNGGYRIIKQRLLAFHGDDHYVGMDFVDPKVDFTALAKSLGMEAMRITEPGEIAAALKSAFSRPGAEADRSGGGRHGLTTSLRAKRSNPALNHKQDGLLRRFAPRNDGW